MLIAEGGRAKDQMDGMELAAKALKRSSRLARSGTRASYAKRFPRRNLFAY